MSHRPAPTPQAPRLALKLADLVSYVARGNATSAAMAEPLGAPRAAHTERPAPDDLVFRHPLNATPL